MIMLGLIFGIVGLDIFTGQERLTFGSLTLQEGLNIAPVVMGIFGIGEIFINLEESYGKADIFETKIKGLFPTLRMWKESGWPIFRGTFLGFCLGIMPGGGAAISSFASYALEKKLSKNPDRFGNGAIQGVAGPEAANNSATAGAFIPLLTLGLPSNVVMAILVGAFLVHGVQPGPLLIASHPEIFWGVIASMYLGNIMLLILNVPLIPIWIKILKIPYPILFPLILLLCLIGVYSINFNVIEIFIMLFFGVVGYIMRKSQFEGAPLILAFILSPMLENAFKQSMLMSLGSFTIFFIRPIALVFMLIALLSIVTAILPVFKKKIIIIKENIESEE
jgi:putative tricarboxylic transport membrane protein